MACELWQQPKVAKAKADRKTRHRERLRRYTREFFRLAVQLFSRSGRRGPCESNIYKDNLSSHIIKVQQIVDKVSDIFPDIFLPSDLLLNIVSTSRAGSRAGRVSPQSRCACR